MWAQLIVAFAGLICAVNGEIFRITPKYLPHPDTVDLLAFQFTGCPDALKMEGFRKRLEKDLKARVRVINIDGLRDSQEVLDAIGHFEGGSFPFYYNRRTGQAINGATTYENLLKWATGDPTHEFSLSMEAADNSDQEIQSYTGIAGVAQDQIMKSVSLAKREVDSQETSKGWRSWISSLKWNRNRNKL